MKQCHIRDASAKISFFAYLEDQLLNKNNQNFTEYEAAMMIDEKRKKLENSMGISFKTISCAGSNAAIIHYTPSAKRNSIIKANEIYLLDSGGQYLDGTTDVTRTVLFGKPG